MKIKIYISNLIKSIIILTFINLNAQDIAISDMSYVTGGGIPTGGIIEIDEGSNSRIQFTVTTNRSESGWVRIYTERGAGYARYEQFSEYKPGNWSPWYSSVDITLYANEFDTTGGILYAEFTNDANASWWSSTSLYNIVVNESTCNLNSPSSRVTTNITSNSAKINWNSVSGNNGYQYQYKKTSSSSWTTGNTSSILVNLTGLLPNTNYLWRIRTECSNGAYGNYSSSVNFTTQEECPENLTITQSVNSSQTDIQESSSTITATNTIFNGATAEYDAGTTVYLKPNFHANNGSNFRAYIEGCQNTKSVKKPINKEIKILGNNIDYTKLIKVYPNPTKNRLTIENTQEVLSWLITGTYGKTHFTGNTPKTIDMSNLPNGIYFLKAILKDGNVVMKKIIKK